MKSRFQNQVVWITGASAGIGRELARVFAEQGADVAVSARWADLVAEVVTVVEGLGRRCLPLPCDVTVESQVVVAVEKIIAYFGHPGFVASDITRVDTKAFITPTGKTPAPGT